MKVSKQTQGRRGPGPSRRTRSGPRVPGSVGPATFNETSGNVFRDLGFSAAEARNLQMRSQLVTALRKFIADEGLTQAEAAKRFHVTQPRISDLVRGQISRFSLDTLVNMLTDAGLGIDLRINRKSITKRVA